MPRNRNKTNTENDPRFFTKRGDRRSHVMDRMEASEKGKERLKGRTIEKLWRRKKDNKIVEMELVPPPFLRRDIRDQNFGDGSRQMRRKPDGATDRPFTKPPAGNVRSKRRARNAVAKASRKQNR
jgi:hypothetical protein